MGTSRMAMWRRSVDLPTPGRIRQVEEVSVKLFAHHSVQSSHIDVHVQGSKWLLIYDRIRTIALSRENSLQYTVRTKADINRRQMDVFALLFCGSTSFKRIDLKMFKDCSGTQGWTNLHEHFFVRLLMGYENVSRKPGWPMTIASLVSCVHPTILSLHRDPFWTASQSWPENRSGQVSTKCKFTIF